MIDDFIDRSSINQEILRDFAGYRSCQN